MRTDGRPLRESLHKMSAWEPHRLHTRRRRAAHAPACAEAQRWCDIKRGRIAEHLWPRATTWRLTRAEFSASEFLSPVVVYPGDAPLDAARDAEMGAGPRTARHAARRAALTGCDCEGTHGRERRPLRKRMWMGADPRTACAEVRVGRGGRLMHGV